MSRGRIAADANDHSALLAKVVYLLLEAAHLGNAIGGEVGWVEEEDDNLLADQVGGLERLASFIDAIERRGNLADLHLQFNLALIFPLAIRDHRIGTNTGEHAENENKS